MVGPAVAASTSAPERRFGALAKGDEGTEFKYQFLAKGWEVQPWQPPHPRPERVAAIMIGSELYFIPLRISQLLRNVILRSRILGLDEPITIQNLKNVIERVRILKGPTFH